MTPWGEAWIAGEFDAQCFARANPVPNPESIARTIAATKSRFPKTNRFPSVHFTTSPLTGRLSNTLRKDDGLRKMADRVQARAIRRVLSTWDDTCQTCDVKSTRSLYHGHRYPREIISHAVWLCCELGVSLRDVEDVLAKRGVVVSYEIVRRWSKKFGPNYARRLKKRHGRLGDTWFLDEVCVTINGQRQYLWRGVDQGVDVTDILVQSRRNRHAAERFFRKLLKG